MYEHNVEGQNSRINGKRIKPYGVYYPRFITSTPPTFFRTHHTSIKLNENLRSIKTQVIARNLQKEQSEFSFIVTFKNSQVSLLFFFLYVCNFSVVCKQWRVITSSSRDRGSLIYCHKDDMNGFCKQKSSPSCRLKQLSFGAILQFEGLLCSSSS